MDDLTKITTGELKERRSRALFRSEKAALLYPETYRELKRMLREINVTTVDVFQYYHMALRLTKLLETLTRVGAGTIFDHYFRSIDPAQDGDIQHFRFECIDLAKQLDFFEKWSAEQHNLKVAK